ncbi:AcrR family transcriptional regulator [Streptosporangium becharense]|uniref:AcrR family transcriptional regulator n=1 Tax=Streptosporangium becharense TaxID=1816182 RepID=A0A7W9MJ99_9ACTN|nr:TetR/AcrR family transcriptional regulator [Streptosporangium becharense]MBB2915108.1 AcrR family transcriptional regulator [Streptosporangium becharense]MBB5822820.1 AcrR family transcriptional regulator [Streptosporangium becharense]
MARGDTRRAILTAALAIVTESGLEAMTVSRLAEVSGASNGSIYHHFGSRGGVVAALYRESFADLVDAMTPALDGRPAEVVVPEIAARFLDWIRDNPARGGFVYLASAGGVAWSEEVAGFKAGIMAPLAAWFAARAASGEVRALPAWALDAVVMGPAHECARRYLAAPGSFDLDLAGPEVTRAVWAIVRPG